MSAFLGIIMIILAVLALLGIGWAIASLAIWVIIAQVVHIANNSLE